MTTTPDSPAPPRKLSAGQKLAGCYVLQRALDSESDSEIWAAQDEVLGKAVSLHFIPAAVTRDLDAMDAIRQEVKHNRQLIHPNILRVYDLVEEADWSALSMDAFDGQPLSAVLKYKGAFDVEVVQPWIVQLCEILDQAHKIQVFHRDLAPRNVFVDPSGKLLLGNFGIGRVIQDALLRSGDPGASSARLASLSPQLLDGQSAARTDDVYGVGALAYQLLTGSPVFASGDIAGEIKTTVPPLISEVRSVGGRAGTPIPANWDDAVSVCLAKSREARPQTTTELRMRIESTPTALLDSETPASVGAVAPIANSAEVIPVKTATVQRSKVTGGGTLHSSPEKGTSNPLTSLIPSGLRSPLGLSACGAAVLLLIVLAASFPRRSSDEQPSGAGISVPTASDPGELTSVKNSVGSSPAAPEPKNSTPSLADSPATPAENDDNTVMLMAAAAPTPSKQPPAASASPPDEQGAQGKITALEKLKAEIAAAEKLQQEKAKQQQAAAAALADAEKALAEKSKTVAPARKAAEEIAARSKKMEEDQQAAEAAAQEAQQLAVQKARAAEDAKKVRADFEIQNKEKLAALNKSNVEIMALQQTLAERQKAVTEATQAAADAEAAKQQRMAAVKQTEQEVAEARVAVEKANAEAEKKRLAMDGERRRLDEELLSMRAMFDQKMKEIEDRRKQLEPSPTSAPDAAPGLPVRAEKPPLPPTAEARPAVPVTPRDVEPGPLAMKTDPKTTPVPPPSVPVSAPGLGNQNSLGMTFAPVGDVLFSAWQTRVKDFEVFAKAINLKSSAWRGPGFRQGADHPVVNVTWNEAVAFCKWLTDKERKEGVLAPNQFYRLPYDLEWSKAVGLGDEDGKTPEARDMGVADVYPWGSAWPPPPGSGNYTGEETGSDVAIKGYNDGFAWTAPVGSFPPNKLGLFDMGGNVWQWCMDSWNNESKAKVLRGASWYNGALKLSLLSSCRVHAAADSSTDNYGFRIVRATESGAKSIKR